MLKKIMLLVATSVFFSNYSLAKENFIEPPDDQCQTLFRGKPKGFERTISLMAIRDLKTAKDDELVRLKGKVTKYLGDESYELTDENNDKIIIELKENQDWSFIHKDEPVELIANFSKNFFSPDELKVRCAMPPEPPMASIGPRLPPKLPNHTLY